MNRLPENTSRQQGFTIIELVVVILLLGILAATALPRFIDVTDQAHEAAFEGVVGGFTTGAALFRSQWVAEGEPTTAITQYDGLFPSSQGYPTGLGSGADDNVTDLHSECKEIFDGILQSGRPSSVHAANSSVFTGAAGPPAIPDSATDATAEAVDSDRLDYAAEQGYAFVATMTPNGTDPDRCTYNYLNDIPNIGSWYFVYDSSDGSITITTP